MNDFKAILKQLLFRSQLYKLSFLQNKFHILAYHMITDSPTQLFPQTPVKEFEKHITYLSRNYNIVSLDELVQRVRAKKSLRRCVAITFDDGFKDNYEIAFPILKKFAVPATFFLTTAYINDTIIPWFLRIRYSFLTTHKETLKFMFEDQPISLTMNTLDERLTASNRIMELLTSCSNDKRILVQARLEEQLEITDFNQAGNLMLSWDQIKEMSKNGISFGAHTVNHPILSRLSLDEARHEILRSKESIQEKTNAPVTAFAYPFGKEQHYTPAMISLLKSLDFSCAVTTLPGANSPKTDLFQLHRSPPWPLWII